MAEDQTGERGELEQHGGDGGNAARTAIKAAAAAAATGAAAVAVKKAFSSGSNGSNGERGGASAERQRGSGTGSVVGSIAASSWEAAQEALLPLAEDAAGAAGTYLAKHGPEIVREKIVPRFVESFNAAQGT